MNVVGYKMFEVAARIGDMNIAALELNTGRSNVTTRIKPLEEQLGKTLFERRNQGVTLTAVRFRSTR